MRFLFPIQQSSESGPPACLFTARETDLPQKKLSSVCKIGALFGGAKINQCAVFFPQTFLFYAKETFADAKVTNWGCVWGRGCCSFGDDFLLVQFLVQFLTFFSDPTFVQHHQIYPKLRHFVTSPFLPSLPQIPPLWFPKMVPKCRHMVTHSSSLMLRLRLHKNAPNVSQ